MDKIPSIKRLAALMGKEVMNNGKHIVLKDYMVEQDGISIITDDKPLFIGTGGLPAFLDQCVFSSTPNPATSVGFTKPENNLFESLQKTLLDNIERVKNDPGYIKQATAINNQVNTLVNMTALQLKVRKSK